MAGGERNLSTVPDAVSIATTDRLFGRVGSLLKGVSPAQIVSLFAGAANGLATLNAGGKIPAAQIDPATVPVNSGNKFIAGWTYANGTDATNDLDMAAGAGVDSAGALWMSGAAMTKQLDANWAAGNNAGGRLSGSLVDGGYNIWSLGKTSDLTVDYGFEIDTNATPTLPVGYGHYRKAGWFRRASGAILGFNTYELAGGGLRLEYKAPTLDKNVSTLGDARVTDQLVKVPPFRCLALLRVLISNNAAAVAASVCNPDETDASPSGIGGQGADFVTSAAGGIDCKLMRVTTSSAGVIAARASNGSTIYRIWPLGFEMSRR